MSKPTAAVKNKYNDKAYDRITVMVKKGEREFYKAQAVEKGYPSLNAYILNLLEKDKSDGE